MTDLYVTTGAAGGGAGTEGDPYTMAEATANVVAGDNVYVKAGTYDVDDSTSSSVMDIDVAGTDTTLIEWIAYTTTIGDFSIGDAQPAIIDASTNTLTNAMQSTTIAGSVYNNFTGFRFTGGSSHGVNHGSSGDAVTHHGCKFDTNGGRGMSGDDVIYLVGCEFTGNTTNSFDVDNSGATIACLFHNESSPVTQSQSSPIFLSNLFYNNGNGANIRFTSGSATIVGNAIDGDNQAASIGVQSSGSATYLGALYNNIFFDLNEGVDFTNVGSEFARARGYNLFFSCNTDYVTLANAPSDISGTSDPFTDSAARDYTLKTGSEALDAGLDQGNL